MRTIKLLNPTIRFRTLVPWLSVAFVAGLVWNPAIVSARPIRIEISATVRSVDDAFNILNGAVAPGDVVTGFYVYDSSAQDSNPLEQVGDYWYDTAASGIRLKVNGLRFVTDPANVSFLFELVNNYNNLDNYLLRSYNNLFDVSATGTFLMNTISWQLDDPSQTALSSTALPNKAPILSKWQSVFGLDIMSSGDNGFFLIRSDVTSAVRIR